MARESGGKKEDEKRKNNNKAAAAQFMSVQHMKRAHKNTVN